MDLLLFLLIVILFPLIWWLMSERGGQRDTGEFPVPPPERRAPGETGYGEPQTGYGEAYGESNGYGERSQEPGQRYGEVPQTPTTRSEAPSPEPYSTPTYEREEHSRTISWSGPVEQESSGQRDYQERHETEHEAPPGSTVHDDSLLGSGPETEPSERKSSVAVSHRQARRSRRALRRLLRGREGMRQAFLVQAVLNPPKALQEKSEDLPGR